MSSLRKTDLFVPCKKWFIMGRRVLDALECPEISAWCQLPLSFFLNLGPADAAKNWEDNGLEKLVPFDQFWSCSPPHPDVPQAAWHPWSMFVAARMVQFSAFPIERHCWCPCSKLFYFFLKILIWYQLISDAQKLELPWEEKNLGS